MKNIYEHEVVETIVDKYGIKSGSKGTVVHIFIETDAVEIEFENNEIVTFLVDEIKPI